MLDPKPSKFSNSGTNVLMSQCPLPKATFPPSIYFCFKKFVNLENSTYTNVQVE